jgi:glycosyltransferase involved in cell wall biosynthesis
MFPDKHSRRAAAAARLTDRLATRASVVIAISQTTQADVVRLLSADPARICVVRPGTPALLDDGNADGARRRELGIEGDYVLVLGTLEPRKNLAVLVEAFGNSPFDGRLRLVIAGKLGWQAGRVLPGIEPLVRTGTAVTPGYVSDAQRAALYRGALCLAFPSIYEGFGLPILEAMAYGTPVIASTAPACVEVLGDAGLLVDPGDPGAWTRAIRTLVSDPALRARLSSTGRQRATLFDWTASVIPLLARLDGSG